MGVSSLFSFRQLKNGESVKMKSKMNKEALPRRPPPWTLLWLIDIGVPRSRGLFIILSVLVASSVTLVTSAPSEDIELDEKAKANHRLDSLNILLYTILLSLTVVTIWSFKHRRIRFLHETGLAVIYGLIVGAIIKYASKSGSVTHINVIPAPGEDSQMNGTLLPPDALWLNFMKQGQKPEDLSNHTYSYVFKGEVKGSNGPKDKEIEEKATFDPEIFFNILLPPIIFNAGYSMKRKYFFRNLGTIFTLAFIGTTVSALVIGGILYGFINLLPTSSTFDLVDLMYFGGLISATDPVTVLAIFNDLHVDVNMYALVFGESVLNDAVAIVLVGAIQNFAEESTVQSGSKMIALYESLGVFGWTFGLSFLIGALMGCCTALLTKFTHIKDFPLLETALFVLMSYSTFLIAEAADLTGIVAVLFCGICQAHYTYNNLSRDSRLRTKQLFELLNFLAENFIFCYIGVSMFTFPKHNFDWIFILEAFLAIIVGRAANIYPLSFLLNLGRKKKIPWSFQHMLFFSGLRGAIAFALAIRNTLSLARQTLLTTTSVIVIVTVIICGGGTSQLLNWLNIPVGVDDETEVMQLHMRSPDGSGVDPYVEGTPPAQTDKALMARWWQKFDQRYMKPLLTHSRPTLLETLPVFCTPIARILTTTEQLTQERVEPINTLSGEPTFAQTFDGHDYRRDYQIGTKILIPGIDGDSI
ncbi:sodium/hydrogen exchanger 9 isoform X4 [Folsomia candida]|uniref:sodium/hydrogen exchanger 9 isoform X4 n=1 Tax=Folsomia candida TaxID=158441 RepID=UPI0016052009|nr:sodium/hydrogen exchanger 9 isoform X4 [Folsomia candida]